MWETKITYILVATLCGKGMFGRYRHNSGRRIVLKCILKKCVTKMGSEHKWPKRRPNCGLLLTL
jgi:hypothetical protein